MVPLRGRPWKVLAAAVLLLLAACAGLPPAGPRVPESAIAASDSTPLGAAAARAAAAAAAAPGAASQAEASAAAQAEAGTPAHRSGFLALPQASYALDARIELMRRAEASLDVQYYLIGKDATGLLLLRELRRAAQRGVRVRLLVDDFYTVGMDALLASLAAEPGVQVRLFNPFAFGRDSAALRAVGLLADFGRLDHRMHNKLLIADGAFAVVGGRNMADEYFLRSAGGNFVDFDALAAGPVVAELARIFDGYWNSEHVLPVERLAPPGACCAAPAGDAHGVDRFEREAERLEAAAGPAAAPPPQLPPVERNVLGLPPLGAEIDAGLPHLLWAEADAYADLPDKVGRPGRPFADEQSTVTWRTVTLLRQAHDEIFLVSPYFIPGRAGLERLKEARQHGIAVRVVTNSLADTDEPLAGHAYRRWRRELLRMGVELYELSSTQLKRDASLRELFGAARGRLHAKLAFIDRRTVVIGSMNLDPRSRWTNTELAVAIRSPALARQVFDAFRIDEVYGVYQVRLKPDGENLQWVQISDGRPQASSDDEPEVGVLQRWKLLLLSLFVAEDWL